MSRQLLKQGKERNELVIQIELSLFYCVCTNKASIMQVVCRILKMYDAQSDSLS